MWNSENSRSGGGKYNWGKEGDQGEKTEAQPEGAEAAPAEAAEAEPVIEEEPEEEVRLIYLVYTCAPVKSSEKRFILIHCL